MNHRLALGVLAGCALLVTAADWPQFLGPARDGTSPETGLVRSWTDKGLPLVWQRDVGEGFSGPVVAGDRLILFHRVGDEDVVECLGAVDGKPKWKFAYATDYRDRLGKGDGPRSTPAVAGKHVYTLSADGRLHCLELQTGNKVWVRALNDDYRVPQSFFGVTTSPLVEGDRVVVNVGGKGGIVALDRATGKEAWKATADPASNASPVAVTIRGQRRLVFFTRTGLVVLTPDGKVEHSQRWRPRYDASVNAASPLVVGDEVFVSTCYETGALLVRLGKDDAREVWSNDESLSAHFNTPVVADGHLYGIHGRQDQPPAPELRCVEWKTGKVKWSKEGLGCAALIMADGLLIVVTESAELLLLEPSPKGYKELARGPVRVLEGPVRAHPALADGRLFLRDGKKLVCLSLKK